MEDFDEVTLDADDFDIRSMEVLFRYWFDEIDHFKKDNKKNEPYRNTSVY